MNEKETVDYIAGRGLEAAQNQEKMLDRVVDAKKALSLAMETVKQEWITVLDRNKALLDETRQYRMAIDGEMSKMLVALGDVRKFFLSADHEKETTRLREFVELCERLQALKRSGFLDQVADTILKLDSKA